MSTWLKNKSVKCRKPHRCHWCGETVEKGELAQYQAGVTDGDMWGIYFHPECYDALRRDPPEYFDDGIPEWDNRRGVSSAERDDPTITKETP